MPSLGRASFATGRGLAETLGRRRSRPRTVLSLDRLGKPGRPSEVSRFLERCPKAQCRATSSARSSSTHNGDPCAATATLATTDPENFEMTPVDPLALALEGVRRPPCRPPPARPARAALYPRGEEIRSGRQLSIGSAGALVERPARRGPRRVRLITEPRVDAAPRRPSFRGGTARLRRTDPPRS